MIISNLVKRSVANKVAALHKKEITADEYLIVSGCSQNADGKFNGGQDVEFEVSAYNKETDEFTHKVFHHTFVVFTDRRKAPKICAGGSR